MPLVIEVTLRSGAFHSFTVNARPRFWKSWAMRQFPYGTSFQGASFKIRPYSI